jgi:hypothetical protein
MACCLVLRCHPTGYCMAFISTHIFPRKVNMSVRWVNKIFIQYKNHKLKSQIRTVALKYLTGNLAPCIKISEKIIYTLILHLNHHRYDSVLFRYWKMGILLWVNCICSYIIMIYHSFQITNRNFVSYPSTEVSGKTLPVLNILSLFPQT